LSLRSRAVARTPELLSAGIDPSPQPAGTIGFVLYGAVPAGDLTHVLDVVEAVRSLAVEALPGAQTTAAVTLAGDPSTADHVERVHQAVQELQPPGSAGTPAGPPSLTVVASAPPVPTTGLALDTAARRVTLGGAEVALTYLEYELLAFLSGNPGRVFSRAELLQYVWGYEHVVGGRTVDVHVKRLRAKLGDDPAVRIDTVRGVGYRFAGPRPAPAQAAPARATQVP
jgi:DNA-binding winged helix-turn-helix (wHTH) protein